MNPAYKLTEGERVTIAVETKDGTQAIITGVLTKEFEVIFDERGKELRLRFGDGNPFVKQD